MFLHVYIQFVIYYTMWSRPRDQKRKGKKRSVAECTRNDTKRKQTRRKKEIKKEEENEYKYGRKRAMQERETRRGKGEKNETEAPTRTHSISISSKSHVSPRFNLFAASTTRPSFLLHSTTNSSKSTTPSPLVSALRTSSNTSA